MSLDSMQSWNLLQLAERWRIAAAEEATSLGGHQAHNFSGSHVSLEESQRLLQKAGEDFRSALAALRV